ERVARDYDGCWRRGGAWRCRGRLNLVEWHHLFHAASSTPLAAVTGAGDRANVQSRPDLAAKGCRCPPRPRVRTPSSRRGSRSWGLPGFAGRSRSGRDGLDDLVLASRQGELVNVIDVQFREAFPQQRRRSLPSLCQAREAAGWRLAQREFSTISQYRSRGPPLPRPRWKLCCRCLRRAPTQNTVASIPCLGDPRCDVGRLYLVLRLEVTHDPPLERARGQYR